GTFIPDLGLANVTKLNVTRSPFEIARLAADIAGGAMLTLPSQADLEHAELGPLITKYMTAPPEVPARERMALFRLPELLDHGRGSSSAVVAGTLSAIATTQRSMGDPPR